MQSGGRFTARAAGHAGRVPCRVRPCSPRAARLLGGVAVTGRDPTAGEIADVEAWWSWAPRLGEWRAAAPGRVRMQREHTNPGFFERARMRNGSARANPGPLA